MTDPNYQVYQGVDITATKRFSNRWQMQAALTLQTNPNYLPEGDVTLINPTDAAVPRRGQHDRAVDLQAAGQLHPPVGHHRLGKPEHVRRRDPDADH